MKEWCDRFGTKNIVGFLKHYNGILYTLFETLLYIVFWFYEYFALLRFDEFLGTILMLLHWRYKSVFVKPLSESNIKERWSLGSTPMTLR